MTETDAVGQSKIWNLRLFIAGDSPKSRLALEDELERCDELAAQVWDRTRGVPLFVRELLLMPPRNGCSPPTPAPGP